MTTRRFSDFAFRLRLKWMWLRHTHPFNWAHKPLCSRFQSGVLQIGKLHVCRSCLFAYCGIVLGSITAFVHPNMIANMKLTLAHACSDTNNRAILSPFIQKISKIHSGCAAVSNGTSCRFYSFSAYI